MKKILFASNILVLLFITTLLANVTPTFAASPRTSASVVTPLNLANYKRVQACNQAVTGSAHCLAIELKPKGVVPNTNTPQGLTPANLQAAYKLPSTTAGQGQTIAIVDAYDNPHVESDLAVYRSMFGLPACTTGNGCFKKVDQNGGRSYPQVDSNWAGEIALDVDMVSAIAPKSHILLVEAKSSAFGNLGIAVNTAVRLGATEISNSYGGVESASLTRSTASYYNHPGVIITASSGDSGYGVGFPATLNTVVAVGGTSLKSATNSRGWTETAWSGAGSGCSSFVSKPTWQKDTRCQKRTITDVSAVADPATGVAVYLTYGYSGWIIYGGTSVASPIIAATYALAGNAAHINGSYLYSHASRLNDLVSGKNGSCSNAYLCTAVTGYDGPTGLGTPNGIGAF